MYDAELFEITWGPTVHALGYAFDKSNDPSIIQKAVAGFRKCAKISAYYGKREVFIWNLAQSKKMFYGE